MDAPVIKNVTDPPVSAPLPTNGGNVRKTTFSNKHSFSHSDSREYQRKNSHYSNGYNGHHGNYSFPKNYVPVILSRSSRNDVQSNTIQNENSSLVETKTLGITNSVLNTNEMLKPLNSLLKTTSNSKPFVPLSSLPVSFVPPNKLSESNFLTPNRSISSSSENVSPKKTTQSVVKTKTYYLAIDIETSGPSVHHHYMPCFGAAFIDVEQCELKESKLFWIRAPPGCTWHSGTIQSFWNTKENRSWYNTVLQKTDANNEDCPTLEQTMEAFVDWIQNYLCTKYADGNIHLVSDNVSFDLGWLSSYLALGTNGRIPHAQYLIHNRFVGQPICSRSFLDGVRLKLHGPPYNNDDLYLQPLSASHVLRVTEWKRSILEKLGVKIDHNPMNDAIVIGMNTAVIACTIADLLQKDNTKASVVQYDGGIRPSQFIMDRKPDVFLANNQINQRNNVDQWEALTPSPPMHFAKHASIN